MLQRLRADATVSGGAGLGRRRDVHRDRRSLPHVAHDVYSEHVRESAAWLQRTRNLFGGTLRRGVERLRDPAVVTLRLLRLTGLRGVVDVDVDRDVDRLDRHRSDLDLLRPTRSKQHERSNQTFH